MGIIEQGLREQLKTGDKAENLETQNLPSMLATVKDKAESAQFFGFMQAQLAPTDPDQPNPADEIVKTFHDYSLSYGRGEKPTEPALSREQIALLAEKHKEYQKLKADIESAKGLIKNEEFFHALLRDTEISKAFGGIRTPDEAIGLLEIYFKNAFESGDPKQVEEIKKIVERTLELERQVHASQNLDKNIEFILQKYEGVITPKEVRDSTVPEIQQMMKDRIAKLKGGANVWEDFKKGVGWFLTRGYRKERLDRKKFQEQFDSALTGFLGIKLGPHEIPQAVISNLKIEDIARYVGSTRQALHSALLVGLNGKNFREVLTGELAGKSKEEREKMRGPGIVEISKVSEEMAKIIPSDEEFDSAAFAAVFGQDAKVPDFLGDKDAQEQLKKLLEKKGVKTNTPLGETYALVLGAEFQKSQEGAKVDNEIRKISKNINTLRDFLRSDIFPAGNQGQQNLYTLSNTFLTEIDGAPDFNGEIEAIKKINSDMSAIVFREIGKIIQETSDVSPEVYKMVFDQTEGPKAQAEYESTYKEFITDYSPEKLQTFIEASKKYIEASRTTHEIVGGIGEASIEKQFDEEGLERFRESLGKGINEGTREALQEILKNKNIRTEQIRNGIQKLVEEIKNIGMSARNKVMEKLTEGSEIDATEVVDLMKIVQDTAKTETKRILLENIKVEESAPEKVFVEDILPKAESIPPRESAKLKVEDPNFENVNK